MAYTIKRDLYYGKIGNLRLRKLRSWYYRDFSIVQHPSMTCSTDWIFKHTVLLHTGILNHMQKHRVRVPKKRFERGL